MSIETIIADLKQERDRLNRAIAELEGTKLPKTAAKAAFGVSSAAPVGRKRRRRLTPEGRKRMSEMMKKRWADKKKKASRG